MDDNKNVHNKKSKGKESRKKNKPNYGSTQKQMKTKKNPFKFITKI